MAVPSSGQLRLRGDIALEVDGSATGINVSLRTLSAAAGKSTPDTMSEFYGYSASEPPTISAASASSVTNTSMTLNSNVTSDGGATITERGFYFGTSTNMTSNPKYVVSGTTGAYSLNRTGLGANTTYRAWAYAVNASGAVYSARLDRATFQTMNYSTFNYTGMGFELRGFMNKFSSAGYSNWRNTDTLYHPYLGGITLENDSGTTSTSQQWIYRQSRKVAQKTSDWGSNLARTRCVTHFDIPWDNFQTVGQDQWLSSHYWVNAGYITPSQGFAANNGGGSYVGGYRWRYNYTGTGKTRVYSDPRNAAYIWNMGSYVDLYK